MSNTPPPGPPGTTGTHIDGSQCATQGTCAHPSHVTPGGGLPPELQEIIKQFQQQAGQQGVVISQAPECRQCHGTGDDVAAVKHKTGDDLCFGCAQVPEEEWDAWMEEAKPKPKPRPKPKHLTNTQHVNLDSDLERLRLQLKAGLNENGRPLKDDERQALERQLEFHTSEITDDDEARALLGVEDDSDAEIKRLLGYQGD